MKVREAMTSDVYIANPQNTIQDVARVMGDLDCGIVPVGENDKLVGMVSDRDIAVRAIGAGKGPDTRVADVMSQEVKYCFENEDLDHVARNMGDLQIRRLPVLNQDKRLVGILALGDVALSADGADSGNALSGISRPGGSHSQERPTAAE